MTDADVRSVARVRGFEPDQPGSEPLHAVFVDANATLGAIARRLGAAGRVPGLRLDLGHAGIDPAAIPALLDGASVALVDHTALPIEVARRCTGLRDVVFLGTGARSYMDPDALDAELGIAVHLIRGYGDRAVAEHAIALLFAAARGVAAMDRGVRAGGWPRTEGVQLGGKTLGLVGLGGIGRETARIASGIGMRVLAWNRHGRADAGGVERVADLDALLAASDAVSLHLLLVEGTRGILSRQRLALMKPGALLVNTARGALADEAALVEALASGRLGHAALDVFESEPLPGGHALASLPNVTLSAHSAFRTPEANENLVGAAFDHLARIAAERSTRSPSA
jgi:D-3-phosphoglycerate dehydrogenase